MSERAERVGGDLELESATGEGCTLRVTVPARVPAEGGTT
jgi:signal transduction histidine kinase